MFITILYTILYKDKLLILLTGCANILLSRSRIGEGKMIETTPHQKQMKGFLAFQSLQKKILSGEISPEAHGGAGTLSDLTLEELVVLQRQVAAEIESRLGMM